MDSDVSREFCLGSIIVHLGSRDVLVAQVVTHYGDGQSSLDQVGTVGSPVAMGGFTADDV